MLKKWKYHIPAVLLAIALMILCTMPKIETQISFNMNDKVAHLLGFFPFTFALLWGLKHNAQDSTPMRTLVIIAFTIAWLYGGLIELIQGYLIPTRFGDWSDFLADGVGCLLGIGLYFVLLRTPLARIM